MKKFEYRLLDTKSSFFSGFDYKELTEHLNSLGSQGWEVVAVVGTSFSTGGTTGLLLTLKREIS